MELRTLRYFVTVVREGSITAAAKSLHVTQPTLSRQLAALEDELGHLLYQRNRKGIELTEQGVILRRYAESILALADKAEEEIALPTHSIAGKVHIAAGETLRYETADGRREWSFDNLPFGFFLDGQPFDDAAEADPRLSRPLFTVEEVPA